MDEYNVCIECIIFVVWFYIMEFSEGWVLLCKVLGKFIFDELFFWVNDVEVVGNLVG